MFEIEADVMTPGVSIEWLGDLVCVPSNELTTGFAGSPTSFGRRLAESLSRALKVILSTLAIFCGPKGIVRSSPAIVDLESR